MEGKLEDTLPAKKITMHSLPSINIFKIQLLQKNQGVCVFIHLFCGSPLHNRKNKYSYSIVGKIEGLGNVEATTEIISDYGSGKLLKDLLNFEYNQFIFSNQRKLANDSGSLDCVLQGNYPGRVNFVTR